MDLNKHSTQGLRDDMNKFVEQNQQIPFTMRNIYRMLDIVIGTTESRMDKALLEVFEKGHEAPRRKPLQRGRLENKQPFSAQRKIYISLYV